MIQAAELFLAGQKHFRPVVPHASVFKYEYHGEMSDRGEGSMRAYYPQRHELTVCHSNMCSSIGRCYHVCFIFTSYLFLHHLTHYIELTRTVPSLPPKSPHTPGMIMLIVESVVKSSHLTSKKTQCCKLFDYANANCFFYFNRERELIHPMTSC